MKKMLIMFGLCLGVFAFAQNNQVEQSGPHLSEISENTNAGILSFESEVVDYGTIIQGSNGEREFKFTNTGTEPIVIESAKGSCGCTVPTFPKAPILPGESASIKVKYDTKRLGTFQKTVTIKSNATEPVKTIKIKGNIVKA